ncbi:MAG: tetratricopeptide repeat protein [Chloroflexales bacterium]|nr:tetratricopeptide repeat protein [Chloroflexales bacterium]
MASQRREEITVLCTDIVDQACLCQQHAWDLSITLTQYETFVQQISDDQDGEFVYTGEVIEVTFTSASAALDAVVRLYELLQTELKVPSSKQFPIRVALYTNSDLGPMSFYGEAARHRAIALLAVAHSGQILLAGATAQLVHTHLPQSWTLHDHGQHFLTDLGSPEHLLQIIPPDQSHAFPALKTLAHYATNLPAQLPPLIGRDKELAAVSSLLSQSSVRLVTLTGVGGVGKTRLALQVAASLLDHYTDGVWFVDLASLSDPALIPTAIAQTLHLTETGKQSLGGRVIDYLRSKHLLLLLDNFEHLLAAAPFLADLVAAAPGVQLLVTSRALLRLSDEHEIVVPPLALPDLAHLESSDNPVRYPAMQLFIDRACAAYPTFPVTADTIPLLAEICHRLDGLPLAIELAAARCKLFTPQALLARLSNRLHLLTGGSRDRPARHQTLRHTLDWSYDLLNAAEQTLLARLAVFAGGWTLEASEAVCGDPQRIESNTFPFLSADQILETLAALVDQSLVHGRASNPGEPRFVLLETIRDYAHERLASHHEAARLHQRHTTYYLALAEAADLEMQGERQSIWLNRLEQEHDNLRTALQWALDQTDLDIAARLASALWQFWYIRGYMSEGQRWLKTILMHQDSLTATLRAHILLGAGVLAQRQSAYDSAAQLLTASLALWQEHGHDKRSADALYYLGAVAYSQNDYERAYVYFGESLTLYRKIENKIGIACVLKSLGTMAWHQGNYPQAHAYYAESLALSQERGDKMGAAAALNNLGNVALYQGDHTRAREYYDASLELQQELGNKFCIAATLQNLGVVAIEQGDFANAAFMLKESFALNQAIEHREGMISCLANLGSLARLEGDYERANKLLEETRDRAYELGDKRNAADAIYELGMVALHQGNLAQAQQQLVKSLSIRQQTGDRREIIVSLEGLAQLAIAQKIWERAALLCGAAEALRAAIGAPLPPVEHQAYTQLLENLRVQIDAQTLTNTWTRGRNLPLEKIFAILQTQPSFEQNHSTPQPVIETTSKPPAIMPYPASLSGSSSPDGTAVPTGLTAREIEILRLVTKGLTNAQIANQLILSRLTVNAHLRSIYRKLDVSTRAAATRLALEQRLI